MRSALDLLPLRFYKRLFGQVCTALTPALVGFALVLAAPFAALQAKTDCSSLDIELQASAEFTTVECDQSSFMGGDISGTREVINAWNSQSVFYIGHTLAGNRTYIQRSDPKSSIEAAFAKTENWTTAPGGNGIAVMRFRGWLKSYPNLPLSCFGFSRFSGHVDRSSGYRHSVFGFYCVDQSDEISDAETRRLIGAVKYQFE